MNDDVADLILIRENAVSLDELFREMIRETFHDVTSHSRTRSARDRVTQNETFEAVAAIGFTVDNVKDFFVQLVALTETARPIVACTATVFGQINILGIVELKEEDVRNCRKKFNGFPHLGVLRCHDCVDNTRLQVEEDSSRDVVIIVGLK